MFPAATKLVETVKSGKACYESVFGKSIWQFYNDNPDSVRCAVLD